MNLGMVVNRTIVSLLPMVPRGLVWRFSRRYIAGTDLKAALDEVERLNSAGMSATLDVLGEDVTEAADAEAFRDLYLEAIDEIARRGCDCNISIKLSQMALRFDVDLCREIIRSLGEAAQKHDNFVRIDMEDSSVTTATLDLYRQLRGELPLGTVVQSCLRRTADDVQALLDTGATHLRLCKGIYLEPEEIAFQDRTEVQESYNALLRQMLEGGIEKVGIATHDPVLVDASRAIIAELQVPKERYEFQMLLGVAERMRSELVQEGHPLRVYVPFGDAWYPYSVRRLRENPQIAGHVLKNLFRRS
ncbi:MAG: proline dehydrogenase family protein [Planctomycetota bacterium]